ncbi:MAG TPA: VOC family protein [Polyangiales bacterium]|nr:VOC family protein [Polyangiales bacterium]
MSTTPATDTPAKSTGLNALKPRILHVAYHVKDIDRALSFYVGVLGMQEQMRLDLSKTLHEVVLQFPDSKGGGVILMWDTAREKPLALGDGYSRFVLMVSDLDASMKLLNEHQTPVVTQPTEAGPLRYAMVKDPDGYVIELLQLKR